MAHTVPTVGCAGLPVHACAGCAHTSVHTKSSQYYLWCSLVHYKLIYARAHLYLKPAILRWYCSEDEVTSLFVIVEDRWWYIYLDILILFENIRWQVIHTKGLYESGAITCWWRPLVRMILHLVWSCASIYHYNLLIPHFFKSYPTNEA